MSYLIMSLAFFLMGCESEPIYIQHVNRLRSQFIAEVQRKDPVTVSMIGGGLFRDVEEVSITFRAYKHADITDARQMIVPYVKRLLELINQDEQVRPYLRQYPFWGVKLRISFYESNEEPVNPPLLTSVIFWPDRKTIEYCIYKNDVFVGIYEESYEDALRIVYP